MTLISAPHLKATRSHQQAMAHARSLVLQACRASPDPTYLKRMRTELTRQGIRAAVAEHDTPALYNWLVDVMSYQGVSDAVAWTYMEAHGRVRWTDLEAAFQRRPACPKLAGFEAFSGCHYRKGSRTCGHPRHLRACPLPRHDLRKGALNQAAYALYLFLRDECGGDLVAWIDGRLADADALRAPDRAARLRQALL